MRKFDHVVEVHIAKDINPAMINSLESGDTIDDNYFTRWLLENYNIKVVVDWMAEGADYNQKIGLSIASNDLPDAFITSFNYWKEAVENEMLLETSELFEQYASPKIRLAYEKSNGGAFDACSVDGKMYGLANTAVTADGTKIMIIRKDWLDQLGLDMPKTIEDVYNVAVAFRDAKLAGEKTIPILGPQASGSLFAEFNSTQGHCFGFDPFFTAMGAYPGFFLEENGEAVYGSFSDEFRACLEMLAKWYQEGLIDPEIGTRNSNDEAISANYVGMFCGPWWIIGYGNSGSFFNDENVNWQPFVVENEKGEYIRKQPNCFGSMYLCISADVSAEVAQAIMTIANVFNMYETDLIRETTESIELQPLRMVYDTPDICEHENVELFKVISGEAASADYEDEKVYTFLYNDTVAAERLIHDYEPGTLLERKHFTITQEDADWQRLYSIMVMHRVAATMTPDQEVSSLIYFQNDTTARYWDNLFQSELGTWMKIITGKNDISAFDSFREQWLREGGQKILDMLNEDLKK